MSLELWGVIASAGTFVVIAATAIAAFIQLRHIRGGNSIAALTECREVLESEEFAAAQRFVAYTLPEMLKDPEVRRRLTKSPLDEDLRPVNVVGNFFEGLGSFIRFGVIDREIASALWSGIVVRNWELLAPTLAIMRRTAGPALWEQFEYLVKVSRDWDRRYPYGIYPSGMERLRLDDVWLEADQAVGVARDGEIATPAR